MPFNYVQESVRQTHHERNLLIYKRPFALDDMDTGGRAPTVGASLNAPTVGGRPQEQLPRVYRSAGFFEVLNGTLC